MITYTPPAASSGPTTALLPYDWAARPAGLDAAEWVQGGEPDVADWTDVAAVGAWGGSLALTSIGLSLGDTALRLEPVSDPGDGPYASGQRGQGVARAVAAGDWVYACRLGLHSPIAADSATTAQAMFVFVNSNGAAPDVTTHRWYGVGLYYNAQVMETTTLCAASSVGVGDEWNTFTASQDTTWWRSTTVDLYLRRAGVTLYCYAAPAGQIPRLVTTRAVNAGSGLLGWRLNQDGATTHVSSVLAFAKLAAVPGV